MSAHTSERESPQLTEKEVAVLRNALEHYVEEVGEDDPQMDEQEYEQVKKHHHAVQSGETPDPFVGAGDVYRNVFREYANALEKTVETKADGEAMQSFFEPVFKSVTQKLSAGQRGGGFR